MIHDAEGPFDSIESSHEFVALLRQALIDARATVAEDIGMATAEQAERRLQALHIVSYKLEQLEHHLNAGSRLLNDLRTLRRMLLGERQRMV